MRLSMELRMMMKNKKKKLFKTIITVWSDYEPNNMELVDIAHAATSGDMICTSQITSRLNSDLCPRPDFFNIDEDEHDHGSCSCALPHD
jgi:hypothetical protein